MSKVSVRIFRVYYFTLCLLGRKTPFDYLHSRLFKVTRSRLREISKCNLRNWNISNQSVQQRRLRLQRWNGAVASRQKMTFSHPKDNVYYQAVNSRILRDWEHGSVVCTWTKEEPFPNQQRVSSYICTKDATEERCTRSVWDFVGTA
jgi:hypothetical protein